MAAFGVTVNIMKITFFIGSLSGGGAERQACQLMNYLRKRKHDVSVIIMQDNGQSYDLDTDIPVYPLCKKDDIQNWFFRKLVRLYRLQEKVRRLDTDCYVVFLPVTALLLLSLKWLKKTKYVYSERVWPGYYNHSFFKILKMFVGKADGVVYQTVETQQFYEPLDVKLKAVIPNAINDGLIKHRMKPLKKEKVIVSAGRLVPEKNFALLIDAFSLVSDEFEDYRLCIFGSGSDLGNLQERVRKIGLESRVDFIEYTLNFTQRLERAALFVLPSTVEGIPNVLMEAMALGVPCVALDCDGGGAKLLLGNNENGILVSKNDSEEMAQAIGTVLSNREYATSMASNANRFIRTFSEDEIYRRWETFLFRVCSG